MNGKTLVAYFSKGGATEAYASVVAEVLAARGHDVDVVDLRKTRRPDLSGYENVVVGTGVRIGRVYRKGRKFLKRADLGGKRLAIFLSSGIAVDEPEKSKERFLRPLVDKLGLSPVMCDAFPGKIPGPNGQLEDRSDPEVARRWAEKLTERWSDT